MHSTCHALNNCRIMLAIQPGRLRPLPLSFHTDTGSVKELQLILLVIRFWATPLNSSGFETFYQTTFPGHSVGEGTELSSECKSLTHKMKLGVIAGFIAILSILPTTGKTLSLLQVNNQIYYSISTSHSICTLYLLNRNMKTVIFYSIYGE